MSRGCMCEGSEIIAQMAAELRITQAAQRLGLDLAGALARQPDRLTDLFEGAVMAIRNAIAQHKNRALAFGELA